MTSATLYVGTRIRDSKKLVTHTVPDFKPSPDFSEVIGAITDVINSDEFLYCPHVLATREWAFPMWVPGAFCASCVFEIPGWKRGESPCIMCGSWDAGHIMVEVPLRGVLGGAGSVVMLGNACRACIYKETGLRATW